MLEKAVEMCKIFWEKIFWTVILAEKAHTPLKIFLEKIFESRIFSPKIWENFLVRNCRPHISKKPQPPMLGVYVGEGLPVCPIHIPIVLGR